jgi:16S rRNA (adenine1518-N6/adenine1519-N6)-dimethyltransferase
MGDVSLVVDMADSLPKKSLGQHWLHDERSLQAMCRAARVESTDVVLEIGPGLGTLTQLLTEQAKEVVAVEFDHNLALALPARVPAQNLRVTESDILRFDFGSLPPDYKIVANIPYYLTSNLVRVISETPNRAQAVALLVQKEVAERTAAKPGDMSILSVSAQYYWQVSLHEVVPAKLFTPPPKVDSQIVSLTRRDAPLFRGVDEAVFFRLVKAGFSQKRKTVLNSLGGGLAIGREATAQLLDRAGINPGRRAQTLSLEEWYRLYESFVTR